MNYISTLPAAAVVDIDHHNKIFMEGFFDEIIFPQKNSNFCIVLFHIVFMIFIFKIMRQEISLTHVHLKIKTCAIINNYIFLLFLNFIE